MTDRRFNKECLFFGIRTPHSALRDSEIASGLEHPAREGILQAAGLQGILRMYALLSDAATAIWEPSGLQDSP
jgi:hypothetical protein